MIRSQFPMMFDYLKQAHIHASSHNCQIRNNDAERKIISSSYFVKSLRDDQVRPTWSFKNMVEL